MNRNWNSGPSFYKKGSFHNKLGMISLWLFIFLALIQVFTMIFSWFYYSFNDFILAGLFLGIVINYK